MIQDKENHIDLTTPCTESNNAAVELSRYLSSVLFTQLGVSAPIGNKVSIRQMCNNRKCINPKHIYWTLGE